MPLNIHPGRPARFPRRNQVHRFWCRPAKIVNLSRRRCILGAGQGHARHCGSLPARAVAESSSLPRLAVAAVAIVYALAWLVWASRAKAGDWLAGTTYACTSALILAPMLWELTLRFKVLPAPATAGVVCGFVIAASVLAWKRDFAPVLWVANVTAVLIALALSIASHQLAPFIAVLLLMVLICEYAAARDRETGVRILVALAADLAIWALIYIYSSPQTARADYPRLGAATLLAPGLALFLILGVSLIYRTVLKRNKITVFETIETMIAFLLAACSVVYFGPPAAATALGIFCIVLSGAGYTAAFVHFDRAQQQRNYLVFATWSAALFLFGSLLCLSPHWQTPWLSAAAVAATFAGARLRRLALELHGLVFLLAAAAISGLLNNVFSALAGTLPGAPGWSIYLVATCTVLCYAAIKPCPGESPKQQVLSIAFAALAIGAAAALLVHGLVGLIALKVIPERPSSGLHSYLYCVRGGHRAGLQRLPLAPDGTDLDRLRHPGASCGEAGIGRSASGPPRIHRRLDLPFCDHSDRGSPRGAHRAKGMRFAGIPGFDIETGDTQSPSAVHLRMLDAIFRSNQLHFADVNVVARSRQQRF